jgi:tryptophan halogenase
MADDTRIRSIAIVGGGTAGWMAAAILARALTGFGCAITVVESADIGIIGVGEATIPPIIDLLRFLDINEADFIRHTRSTYKLGIKFTDWRAVGHSYWHPFGTFGAPINRRPFFAAWLKAKAGGLEPRFNDFSLCAALGDEGRFRHPDPAAGGPRAGLRYALHFDAGLVAQYLRAYAEKLGVVSRHAARRRLPRRTMLHGRLDSRGRSLHRRQRLPRRADRAGARDRLSRLDQRPAVRPRRGHADADVATPAPLH